MAEARSVFLYPWDALDEGVGPLFDRLESTGLNGVKLACVYHTGKLLLAANPRRRVYVPEDGAMHFRPGAEFKERSRLYPPISSLCQAADPLDDVCAEAKRRRFFVDAWVVTLHNRALAISCPGARVVNAFGDPYPHALCPSRPEVRGYVEALVADLTRYPVRRIALEAFCCVPYRHYSMIEIEGVSVGPGELLLLSICFCEDCRGRYPGLADLRGPVRARLEQFFQSGRGSAEEETLSAVPGLDRLLEARMEAMAVWGSQVARLARERGAEVTLFAWPSLRSRLFALDFERLAREVGAVGLIYYRQDSGALAPLVEEALRTVPSGRALDLCLRPGLPDTPTEENLREKLRLARRAGIREFSFYNYGILPARALAWLRGAFQSDAAAQD